MDSIVLETDAPFLTPDPHRGKRNESSYLNIIAKKLAEILEMNMNDVVEKTSANAIKLFNLKV